MENLNIKKYLAEFLGTFCLVFCGTGAIVIHQECGEAIGHIGIAITFGLIVATMIYAFGPVSGAHLNPAVSLALSLARRFEFAQLLPYIIAQTAGALTASSVLQLMFPASETLGATLPAGSAFTSFILEFLLTSILMLVIMLVAVYNLDFRQQAGMIIGAVVLLEAMFAGPISGASMNPARSLAPALIGGQTQSLWVYLIAPPLGAMAAVPVAKFFCSRD